MNNSSDVSQITLSGIVRKNFQALLKNNLPEYQITYSTLFSPNWSLVKATTHEKSSFFQSYLWKLKSFLILATKKPSSTFGFKFQSIEIKMDYSLEALPIFREKIQNLIGLDKTYIPRNLGTLGLELEKLDLSLEYDLVRRFTDYKIIFTKGKISSGGIVVHSILADNDLNLRDLNEKTIKIISGTYLPVSLDFSHNSFDAIETGVNSSLVTMGKLSRLTTTDSSKLKLKDRWKYKTFESGEILHGQVLKYGEEFFISDPKRHANWGESMNLIPGVVFQSRNSQWCSPMPIRKHSEITEAIFLGGTNNLMHTILEDVPRLFLSADIGIDPRIPLLISSQLSPQIVDLIKRVSSRSCISLDLYSSVTVKKLHFFQFDSPLPDVMKGDVSLGDELFGDELAFRLQAQLQDERTITTAYKDRILILRESGLFRPVTNIREVQRMLEQEFGFHGVYFSKLDYFSVRKLLQSCSIVVGEYGAALANSIHLHPGSSILEIRGPLESRASEYEIVSKSLGLKHSLLIGKLRPISRFGLSRGPYKVPISVLREMVGNLLRESQ